MRGVAYDTPILGYRERHREPAAPVEGGGRASRSTSRPSTRATTAGAVDQKVASENITKVLYPNDELARGKRLRLEQQYFFVSCALQDMIRIHLQTRRRPLARFHEKYAVQLNDTHPAIAVAELMRLLVDVHGMGWERGLGDHARAPSPTRTTRCCPRRSRSGRWRCSARVLPRHLEIVYEINRRFLDEVRARYPGDDRRAARLSLIDETGARSVRMAHLASVGSHRINGVARPAHGAAEGATCCATSTSCGRRSS